MDGFLVYSSTIIENIYLITFYLVKFLHKTLSNNIHYQIATCFMLK